MKPRSAAAFASMPRMSDFQQLSELSAAARRGVSAAELHGAACGIAVTTTAEHPGFALVELLGADALAHAEAVDEFMAVALDSIVDEELAFEPLLLDVADGITDPEDFNSDTAAAFVEALAQWCAAFVAGLFAGLPAAEAADGDPLDSDDINDGAWVGRLNLGPDAEELVQDLVAIAQLDTTVDADALDDQEAAFTELREFVRVAVMLLAAGRNGASDGDAAS